MKTETIVKVQLPLGSNDSVPMALVYSEGRKRMAQVAVSAGLRERMRGRRKAFFYATYHVANGWRLLRDAPDQEW